jgi:secondary thiamine-phosphate synthase enzyme
MNATLLETENNTSVMKTYHQALGIQTEYCMQFIDITDKILELVKKSSIENGIINIQTRHTTTGILINEHEPLLLDDIKQMLERLAPQNIAYQHNNFAIRTVNLTPNERENGHSHCKAIFLKASETLNIANNKLQLGTWQRIFFVELDGALSRNISIMMMGV